MLTLTVFLLVRGVWSRSDSRGVNTFSLDLQPGSTWTALTKSVAKVKAE